jgi:hypothetical protein
VTLVQPDPVAAQFSSSGAEQISVGAGPSAPDNFSSDPAAPPNGNIVVFSSRASNIVANDTNGLSDIFQYSPERGMELVSVSQVTGTFPGAIDGGLGATAPAISNLLPDGNYAVAFLSESVDIVPSYQPPLQGEKNPRQVYLRIPNLNQTILLSVSIASSAEVVRGADSDCDQVSVVALANPTRYLVAFRSAATNLRQDAQTPNRSKIIFFVVVNLSTGVPIIERVDAASRLSSGAPVDADLNSPVISGDGRFIAFSSRASLGGPGEANGKEQVWLFERSTFQVKLISSTPQRIGGNEDSFKPSISFKGEFIAYLTKASDIVLRTTNNPMAVLFNLSKLETKQINTSATNAPSDGSSHEVAISPGGKLAVFSDDGSTLAPGISPGVIQTYMKDLSSGAVVRVSATADGAPGNGNSGALTRSSSELFTGRGSALAFGSTGFSSPRVFAIFRSAAQNLTAFGTSSDTSPNVFRTTVAPPKSRFQPNAKIEAPPDVLIRSRASGKRGATVVLTFQEFDTVTDSAAGEVADATAGASSTARLEYRVEVRKSGSQQRQFRVVSRNTVTIRKLTPGRYTVRYRVIRNVGGKSTKTRYSPKASVEIT